MRDESEESGDEKSKTDATPTVIENSDDDELKVTSNIKKRKQSVNSELELEEESDEEEDAVSVEEVKEQKQASVQKKKTESI